MDAMGTLSFWLPWHSTFSPSMHRCPLRSDQCRQRPSTLDFPADFGFQAKSFPMTDGKWDEGYIFFLPIHGWLSFMVNFKQIYHIMDPMGFYKHALWFCCFFRYVLFGLSEGRSEKICQRIESLHFSYCGLYPCTTNKTNKWYMIRLGGHLS